MKKSISQYSIDWMPKSVWGPIKWRELHYRGLVDLPMKDEDKWFKSFVNNIPCPRCQKHFEKFVKENPPDFHSRTAFFVWTILAHNYVNEATGKPIYSIGEALAELKENK